MHRGLARPAASGPFDAPGRAEPPAVTRTFDAGVRADSRSGRPNSSAHGSHSFAQPGGLRNASFIEPGAVAVEQDVGHA